MNNDRELELLKRAAKEQEEDRKQIKINPLSQYSTTQLKAELRRRKGN